MQMKMPSRKRKKDCWPAQAGDLVPRGKILRVVLVMMVGKARREEEVNVMGMTTETDDWLSLEAL